MNRESYRPQIVEGHSVGFWLNVIHYESVKFDFKLSLVFLVLLCGSSNLALFRESSFR